MNIDILVCYRLDRISRNVADFSSTLEILQNNNCEFISIREQFDTSSPMGRAMIYIASVFAQLERETIAERVKDNMLEMAKNGLWTGGKIPIGFISNKIKYTDNSGNVKEKPQLVVNEDEAKFIVFLYNKYLELGSLYKLECYLIENQIKSKNEAVYQKSSLKLILQSPTYVKANADVIEYLMDNNWMIYGEPDGVHALLTYNKTEKIKQNGKYTKQKKSIDERFASVSSIRGIVNADLWLEVQKKFHENKNKFPRLGKSNNALLVGKLKCGKCYNSMLVQHGKISKVTGEKQFYYICSLKRNSHRKLCDNSNAKTSDIERLVISSLKEISQNRKVYLDKIKKISGENLNLRKEDIEKASLEKSLSDKKLKINNLVDKLSNVQSVCEISDILIEKINNLKNECITIEGKITNLDNIKVKIERLDVSLIESILDECLIIDKLEREEQKFLIDNLIDEIYYFKNSNGVNEIKIKFIGSSNNNKIEYKGSLLEK